MIGASQELRDAPRSALGIATNGTWALGLRTADQKAFLEHAKLQAIMTSREFVRHISRSCRAMKCKTEGLRLLSMMETVPEAAGTPELHAEAVKKVRATMEKLPDDVPERDMGTNERRDMAPAMMEMTKPPEAATTKVPGKVVAFCVAVCKGTGEWKVKDVVIPARAGLIPMLILSESHVAVLYCDANTSMDEYDLTLRYWTLPGEDGRMREVKEWKTLLRFDPVSSEAPAAVCFSIRPSQPHMAIVALGTHIYFLDAKQRGCAYYHFTPYRTITTVLASDDCEWFMGTDLGEVYRLGAEGYSSHVLPDVMPVLQIAWNAEAGALAMRTWVYVFLATKDGTRTKLNTLMPCAVSLANREMAILTRNGFIQVRPFMWILNAEIRMLEPPHGTLCVSYSFFYNQLLHLHGGKAAAIDMYGRVRFY